MAVSPDQEERRAIAKDPAKYNPRNPWTRVDEYVQSLRNRPQIVLPTEEETKFADLPVEDYGNVQANRDRWAAAEELASAIASRRESEQKEFEYSPGMPYPEYDTLQDKNFVQIAQEKLDAANARVLEFSERLQNPKPLSEYPTLTSALMQTPDLTEADVRRVVNFAAAWTASDAIMSAPDMQSQWNIFLSLPEIQQLVVWDIWQERVKEIQDEAQRAEAEAELAAIRRREEASGLELAAMDIGGTFLTAGSAALTAIEFGYENVQRYARAVATASGRRRQSGEKAELAFLKAATIDPFFIWDEVGPGTWNNQTLQEARSEYGDDIVDIVVEVQDLADDGDPSPISTLQAKYYADPEKARILRLLTERQFRDPELLAEQQEILSAADKILSAQASDLGKILTTTNPLTGAPIPVDAWWRGSQPQQGLSAATNVVATFALDPLIVGSKIRGVYLGAKYGLERIAIDAGEKTVTAALSKPTVNAYLIDLTADLKKYDDLAKAGKDTSQLGQVIANRYKNYFPEDVLFTMSKEGVHSPEALINYVNDTNRMLSIERGKALASDLTPDQKARAVANIEDKSVFARMARQQMAKRGQPLLPRNSILWASHLRRQFSDALSVGARRKSARKEVKAFYEDANNPDLPAGAILFNDPAAVANFDSKITGGWDRVTRWAAQTTGRDTIYTADARDTQVFRRFARLFMSSSHADYLANRWRNADQGERVLMWIGVVRAAAERRGASEIADKTRNLGTRVINNKSSLTVQEITDELTFSSSARSLFAPESFAIDDAGRTVDDWVESKVDEFVAQREQAGLTAGRSKQELDAEVDGYRAALLNSDPEAINVSQNAVRTSPASFGDQQLALHLWQTSDYLAVPNLSDLELITKRSKITNAIIGATPDSVVNNAVNWWSLINLAGFRYSVRNATEDYTMYALTGGYFKDVVTGRVMSTAAREARGLEVGGRPNIGFIARRMRARRGEASEDYNPYSVWDNIILPQLNKDEIARAKEAMSQGDLSVFRALLTTAVVRQKLGKTVTKEEQRYLSEYVLSDESFLQLDDLVELSQGLNLGTMPSAKFSGQGFTASMGNKVVWPRSSFMSLDMKGGEPFKYSYWHRGLEGVLVRDGVIGKVAVANLDDPQAAVRAVAEAIESDTKYRYKDRLAAFYEMNVSSEEFAARYVQDVLNMFSRRDGSFNNDLWSKFVFRAADGTRRASWNMKVDGKFVPIVSLDDLSKIDADNAPRYILGKGGGSDPIEIPASVSERIWDAMGNAFARIGKEPIYFANYVRSRKGLTKYENQLAEAVGPKAASIASTRIAQDRALALTLAFTDNPKNRSMLAYRLRNYARYYRAQEDFYRRVYRAVKYDPMSVYKGYLAIGVLDETGFIYEDSYGEKYFLYPGDALINNVMARAMAFGGGDKDGLYFSDTPLTFGGKVKMWAPSFDVNAAVPMLSSPLSTLGIKTVMNLVPQFQKYEDNILGDYAVGRPTPEASLPGPFVRLLGTFDQDERNSMYAGAWMGAARVLAGAGLLPDEGASEEEIAKGWEGIASIANQIILLRFALGFVYPAIPQVMENNVTTYARQYGYDGMTSVYRELVDKAIENGDPDPYSTAMMQGVSIYGLGFTAYDIAKTKQGAELKSLPEYSYDLKLIDFKEENGKLISDYPSAAMFLGPVRTEDDVYDPASRRWLMDNDYRTPVSIQEFKEELRLSEAMYVYQVTMDDADDAIRAATTPEEVEKAEQDKKAAKALVYATYNDVGLSKYFQTKAAEKQSYADRMLNGPRDENGVTTGQSEMRRMVKDFYDGKYGDTVPKSVEKIAEAIATYDLFTASSKEIVGRKRVEVDARRENRFKLLANLQSIAEEDPNAEMFIRRVMYPLLDARPDGTPR